MLLRFNINSMYYRQYYLTLIFAILGGFTIIMSINYPLYLMPFYAFAPLCYTLYFIRELSLYEILFRGSKAVSKRLISKYVGYRVYVEMLLFESKAYLAVFILLSITEILFQGKLVALI